MREFEKDIKIDEEYSVACLAKRVPGGTIDDVACDVNGFQSPLDFFAKSGKDVKNLETMSDEEIQEVLIEQVKDKKVWKDYNPLFDNKVDPDSSEKLEIKYMRSLITQAGPIKDGDTRYESVKDNKADQDLIVTDFQKTLRSRAAGDDVRFSGVKVEIMASQLFSLHFQEMVAGDVTWATFSGLFVFCFIWFHLESFFMAALAML